MKEIVAQLIASAMLLVLVLNGILPAFLADRGFDLPACCRRDGQHHCAMMDMLEKERGAGPSWRSAVRKCPMYPKSTQALFVGHWAALRHTAAAAGLIGKQQVSKAYTEVLYRISHSRTRQKRGPPSLA